MNQMIVGSSMTYSCHSRLKWSNVLVHLLSADGLARTTFFLGMVSTSGFRSDIALSPKVQRMAGFGIKQLDQI